MRTGFRKHTAARLHPVLVPLLLLSAVAAGPAGANLIQDPSLEGTPPGVWSELSTDGYDIIVTFAPDPVLPPPTGAYLAWLGGTDDSVSQLWQTVAVPAGVTDGTLTWHQWIRSTETDDYDFASVRLNGLTVDTQWLKESTETHGWAQRSISLDLAPYAGSSAEIRFYVETDGSVLSDFFLDDVSLEVRAIPAPAALLLGALGTGLAGWLHRRRTL